jgi:hypothetical protein
VHGDVEYVEYRAALTATCSLTITAGGSTQDASTPSRQLGRYLNARDGGTIESGKMSHGEGVWGVQIDGPGPGSQLLGGAVVRLAPHRMAQLGLEVVASDSCAQDEGAAAYGAIKHLLRTARFHARLVYALG